MIDWLSINIFIWICNIPVQHQHQRQHQWKKKMVELPPKFRQLCRTNQAPQGRSDPNRWTRLPRKSQAISKSFTRMSKREGKANSSLTYQTDSESSRHLSCLRSIRPLTVKDFRTNLTTFQNGIIKKNSRARLNHTILMIALLHKCYRI